MQMSHNAVADAIEHELAAVDSPGSKNFCSYQYDRELEYREDFLALLKAPHELHPGWQDFLTALVKRCAWNHLKERANLALIYHSPMAKENITDSVVAWWKENHLKDCPFYTGQRSTNSGKKFKAAVVKTEKVVKDYMNQTYHHVLH